MTFSLDELTQDLGIPSIPTDSNSPAIKQVVKGKSFLTAQFPILSTPYFIIYLQGAAEWVDTITSETTEQELLTMAFTNSKSRVLGRDTSPNLAIVVKIATGNKANFYVNKAWHKDMLTSLVEEGAKLDASKVANRAFPLAAINNYLDALAAFLTEQGYSTATAYLQANANKRAAGPAMSLEDLQGIWDQL